MIKQMRILIISDLHLDFHKDGGVEFLRTLDKTVDAVLLAGDLCAYPLLEESIDRLCNRFHNSEILYVIGNHEPYHTSLGKILGLGKLGMGVLDQLEKKYNNLSCLDCVTVSGPVKYISGQKFIGTPLWFRNDPMIPAYRHMLNDFRHISDYQTQVFKENKKSTTFLNNHVEKNDIVITHHVPLGRPTNRKYQGSPLNKFFLCDMEQLIVDRQPKLWIFGHTHDSYDSYINNTRLICNPLGYPFENTGFNKDKVIEI